MTRTKEAGAWVLLLLLALAGPAQAYQLRTDASGSQVRWENAVHFVIDTHLDQTLRTSGALSAVARAVETYARPLAGLEISAEGGAASGELGYDFAPGATNQSEIVAVEDWEFDPDALAVTIVTVDSDTHRILDADIAINARDHRFGVLDSRPTGDDRALQDVQSTLTHELGHAFGLAHNTEAPDAVMYPTADPGQTAKRVLSADDLAGLSNLYQLAPSSDAPPAQGCAAAPGSSMLLPLLAALLLLSASSRRRRARGGTSAVVLALIAAPALAAPPERAPAPVNRAEVVLTAEVVSTRISPPQPGDRLLHTELTLRLRECLKGGCSGTLTVRVPGGRLGSIEQWVEGEPPPRQGEVIALALEPQRGPARPHPGVYRLSTLRDFDAFARGCSLAGLRLSTPAPSDPVAGSPDTRASR